jgi:hypothetical protein
MLPSTTAGDRDLVFGPGINHRVHTVEFGWLDAIIRCELFVYRLPADRFLPVEGDAPHAFVFVEPVMPAGPPEPVGDLLALHHSSWDRVASARQLVAMVGSRHLDERWVQRHKTGERAPSLTFAHAVGSAFRSGSQKVIAVAS